MDTLRLALIGFGNVGQGFTQILAERGEQLARANGLHLQIVAVCDLLKGSLYNPAGLNPAGLLAAVQSTGRIDAVPAPHRDWDTLKTIASVEADALVELSYTDLKTGEPAITHLRAALERGLHVGEIHHPAEMRVHGAAHVDLDAKRMPVHPRALVTGGHVRQPVRTLERERLENFH